MHMVPVIESKGKANLKLRLKRQRHQILLTQKV
jgi:hypothetical protein